MKALQIRIVQIAVAASIFEQKQRNCINRRDVVIVRIERINTCHSIGKSPVHGRSVGGIVVGWITHERGFDQRALHVCNSVLESVGTTNRNAGGGGLFGTHAAVKKGAPRKRFAPKTHSARGIEFSCFYHGCNGFWHVVCPAQLHALIKNAWASGLAVAIGHR